MPAKKKLHFAGIGGIGMSALAQMSASLGFATSGSDRAAASPENARIFNALKAQGITIHPQDGSVTTAARRIFWYIPLRWKVIIRILPWLPAQWNIYTGRRR